MNRTTLDLDSATARVRLFGGRSAAEIASEFPILPVDTPDIPEPGAAILAQAVNMGDQPYATVAGTKRKRNRPTGVWLTALVRSLLYQTDTTVVVDGEAVRMQTGVVQDSFGCRFGPSRCRLMVVGKCLGRAEVDNKMPFCGPGSRDLWTAWAEAGLPAAGPDLPTYLTNVMRFAPSVAAATKPISKELMADGRHLLWQEFAVCRPEVVLLLGADAVKAVLGRAATVTSYRGRIGKVEADFRPDDTTPHDKWSAHVVVADHPAAVARKPEMYPSFLASIRSLSRLMGFATAEKSIPLDHQVVLTVPELKQAVAESEKASAGGGYVAFDCEWEGAHPTDDGSYLYTVQWSHAPGHARVVFLRRTGGAENPSLPLADVVPLLNRLLKRAPARGARLVGHFVKSDLAWLESIGVDLYDEFVGPQDDPPDAPNRMTSDVKSYFEGAFDTYVAAHAVSEAREKKLEVMAAVDFGLDRYDTPMDAWKVEYCKAHKIKRTKLKGYGNAPEELIAPYAMLDADVCGREYLHHNGDPRTGTRGLLDKDEVGMSSRLAFSCRMRAWAAMAEMERYGMEADVAAHRRLTDVLLTCRTARLEELRSLIHWPTFTPSKRREVVELLFGPDYSPNGVPIAPPGAMYLNLPPYKATEASGGHLWAKAVAKFKAEGGVKPEPAADKETLVALTRMNPVVKKLMAIAAVSTALKSAFRPPEVTETDDDEPDEEHTAGMMSHLRGNGRIGTMLGFVETGRLSSSKPNLQNLADSSDEIFNGIMEWGKAAPKGSPEANMKFVSRSMLKARDGWFLVDADLKGAEIFAAGIQSGDQLLIEHARRSTLPEDHPEWLDLHSDLAAGAFGLTCSYAEIKEKHKPFRVAAKRARFGHYYGASPETILRQCLMESPNVTLEQVVAIVEEHDRKYPTLARYFYEARRRTHRGWMRNGRGGMRRFRKVEDREIQAAQERAGQNWTCQGLVADHISEALGALWYERNRQRMRSRILLTIHDSVVMECPPDEVEFVHDQLLPWAMGWGTPIYPTTFDGTPVGRGPYFFGVSCKVCRSWGIDLPESEWRSAK